MYKTLAYLYLSFESWLLIRAFKTSQTINLDSGYCSCCHCLWTFLWLTVVDVRLYVHQGLIFSDNSVPEVDQGPKSNIKLPEHFSVFRAARSTIVGEQFLANWHRSIYTDVRLYRVIQKMDSILYVYIFWTIHDMWMIYITFERGGPKFSNTTARALA